MVRDRLAASPFAGRTARRGRADRRREPAQPGSPISPARILRRPVRIGAPARLCRLAEAAKGPAFAVAAGLLGLSTGGPSRTLRTAANAAIDDRDGRLHGTGSDDGCAESFC